MGQFYSTHQQPVKEVVHTPRTPSVRNDKIEFEDPHIIRQSPIVPQSYNVPLKPPNESPWYNSPYAMNIWTKPPPSPWYPVGFVRRGGRRLLLEEQQIDGRSFRYRVIVPQLGMVIMLFPDKVRGIGRLYSGQKVRINGLKGEFVVFRRS